MSEFNGTPAEIKSQIERARRDMGDTVDELVDRLHPKNQFKAAKETASGAADNVRATLSAAADGDDEARRKLGKVAGVVAAVAVLILLKRRRR